MEDPYYLPSESVFPSSIQGFSLCYKSDRIPIASFFCFPYILKRGWRAERVLRITRPLLIPMGDDLQKEVLKCLMQEIGEIGKRAGVHIIEAELYAEIKSRIFFPSTNCAVNTYNPPEWIGFFENAGFICSERCNCFELELDNFSQWDTGGVSVRKCNLNDDEDKKLYYRLWTLSGECPYALADLGFWYPNVFGWPRLWYSETPRLLNREDYILFAERKREPLGFIHWWPNLYPLLIRDGWNAIYRNDNSFDQSLDRMEEGKIFKVIVGRKVGEGKKMVRRALMSEAIKIMKEKFGFKKCQITNVPEEREDIRSHICEKGGQKVHEVCLMRRRSG
jgi:hypothetical protein